MRTAARETAPQIALRNCSKEAGEGEVRIYMILVKGKYMQSNIIFFFQKVSASHKEQS